MAKGSAFPRNGRSKRSPAVRNQVQRRDDSRYDINEEIGVVQGKVAHQMNDLQDHPTQMGKESESEESIEDRGGSGSESEEDSDLNAEEGLQEQVADVPFEDLQKARSDGRTTLFSRTKKNADTKRANKNRPMETTAKRPVGRFREVIQAPKRVIRDPRFESLCGDFNESRFKSSYSFLYDEELPAERQRLQRIIAKGTAGEEVQTHLAWINKQIKEEEQRRIQVAKTAQHNSIEKLAVKDGKKPFYPKKADVRKQELVEKFKELKSSGKLDKFMAKRRKKNATKDHRFVPYRRNSNEAE